MNELLTVERDLATVAGVPSTRDDHTYVWKTQDGLRLKPIDMRTGHLFHTVVMLWHHFMPEKYTLKGHKRWHMGPRFTPEYVQLSFRVLMSELVVREDLGNYQVMILRKMAGMLKERSREIECQRQIERRP